MEKLTNISKNEKIDNITKAVCDDLQKRSILGIKKYGQKNKI